MTPEPEGHETDESEDQERLPPSDEDPLTPSEADPESDESAEDQHRVYWADTVADKIEARNPDEPIIVKGGVSPSGVPHIGHLNEIIRGYLVAEVLRERGYEVDQVFTSDDKDRLRGMPRTLASLDWEIVGLGDVDAGALGQNLGKPLTDVPDPFGCCESFGAHQTKLLSKSAEAMGVPIEILSNTELYAEGAFEAVTRELLEQRERAYELLSAYQDKVDESYVPFSPQCSECGHLTETVTGIDLDAGTVDYVCESIEAGNQIIEGCGHEGTATFREGKLPWRFEWPAQWKVLGVDFEPFGKDHAEGSWPSGEEIARELLDSEPPVPMVYEWFTYNGEALSSSSGHILTVRDVLSILEPEVFRYFFTKDPNRARDFDVRRLDQLVDEFDRFESIFFDEVETTDRESALADRAYPMVVEESRDERVRIPYTFAAVLGMTDDENLRETMARRSGHLPDDASVSVIDDALSRVENARNWAVQTDNEYNYRLAETLPEVSVSDPETAALSALAEFIEQENPDGEALQAQIYDCARENDVDVSRFFELGYRLFLDQPDGPRLGPFLAAMNQNFVLERLRRESIEQ
ncbi:lysine--tRNA ligase [Halocatena marina]|uniref:Lysine--tRNA ligase n=1 Tax=Halocatena marina TaxID=2934937 RepID=A0ABD5YSF4_9EURY|nr:lysine--tRNA ligase [Halocatena marina]